jgi:hypothetical protein
MESSNTRIAERLSRVAELLEAQGASPFRVRAWRLGAQAIVESRVSVADLFRADGMAALHAIPGIGRGLGAVIAEIVRTGHARILDRLEGEASVGATLAGLPGLGPTLARRVHDDLGIDTLEELEEAAHDGRLARVRGFGPRRLAAVRDQLTARLGLRPRPAPSRGGPPVSLLLDEDRRYRERVKAGTLRLIAPRRMNPRGEAWLPVMHEERDGWAFSVMFSNTPQAHELGKTDDWVVIYYQREGDDEEGRATVVTETRGPWRGRRVVRGREHELAQLPAADEANPLLV